ncbi:MAG: redox-regulated ATPase YchF [Rhodospirillales bacterium]|nr:redox-regulated ATPase YchF [Rhodospirillales bacterium]
MGFNCGIVGMPNVGKSTLFNALTSTAAAEAANFPFCTIEPNTGRVGVPDPRLAIIAELGKSAKIIPTQLEFVDIAGLVRGASKGEGLGNQFLANIRETDAIIHVLRCFEDENITHVEGGIDPVRDAETIETELMLADLESLENRMNSLVKKARGNDKQAKESLAMVERCLEVLKEGQPARTVEYTNDEAKTFQMLQLLTSKPILYVCNVEEESAATGNSLTEKVSEMAIGQGARVVVISAKIEEEVAQLTDEEEKKEFLETLDLEETGLAQIIREGQALLNLITFFTVGPKEARAWTVRNGASAPEAAGVIHTDFERGFIKAETIAYDDFVECQGESGAKEAGKMRQEGKAYPVKDGDIFHFRFNV